MHNAARELHVDTSPLSFKQSLADDALAWSQYMADNALFEHSSSTSTPRRVGQGENIHVHIGNHPFYSSVARAWYAEILDWDYDNAVSSWNGEEEVDNFTQMVWTDTSEVGCGEATGSCPATWGISETTNCFYTTCRYEAPGNVFYSGDYQQTLDDHVKPQIPPATE